MSAPFSLHSTINAHETFSEFAEKFALNENDLIFVTSIIYDMYIKPLGLPCQVMIYEEYCQGEPTEDAVDTIYKELSRMTIHRVIGVGGGAVLDTAKLLALKDVTCAADVFEDKIPLERDKKLILIPTTCGTGSEISNTSIIYRPALDVKIGKNIPCNFCDDAVLIPELLSKLPRRIFANTAFDALAHNIEIFLGPNNSPVTKMICKEGIALAIKNLALIADGESDEAYKHMLDFLMASTFGGIGMANGRSNSSLHSHAFALVFGARNDVPHGESVSIFLISCLRIKARKYPDGNITALAKVINEVLGTQYNSVEAVEKLGEILDSVYKRKPLREYGMKREDIPVYVQDMIDTQQRLIGKECELEDFNDFVAIYEDCF